MTTQKTNYKKFQMLLIARDKFPPYRADVATLFGNELAGRGHSIDCLLQSEIKCDKDYQTKWGGGRAWVGANRQGTGLVDQAKKHIYSFLNDLRMFDLARKNSYDIIQVRDKLIAGVVAIVASRLNQTRFVYWLSFPIPESKSYRAKTGLSKFPHFDRLRGCFFGFLLYRVIMPNAMHVFVQSEQMKRDVASKGIPNSKLTAVPMGVSIDRIRRLTHKIYEGNELIDTNIVYLGDLGKVRNMDFLLRVHHMVLQEMPSAKLYLVGGAENPDDILFLKQEAEKLGISDFVHFTGFIPMEEAWEYVRTASVCVSPLFPTPIFKPASPTKIIEYMANCKPVVVNDHPEQKQVIDDSGGGICVPYEEEEFSRAIVSLLNDREKGIKMGKKGRKYVEHNRSYSILADLVEKKYLEICANVPSEHAYRM